MNITKEEFYESLKLIDGNCKYMVEKCFVSVATPELANKLAIYCFIIAVPESEYTTLLRQYLIELKTKGYAEFKGE